MDKQGEKQRIIAEYLLGGVSTRKLANRHGYSHATVSRWVMAHQRNTKNQPLKFSKKVLETKQEMLADVQELQEALRLSQLKVELLEAMIDISDEQFGTAIRKKAGTRQS